MNIRKNVVMYGLVSLFVMGLVSSVSAATVNITSAVSYLNDALDAFAGVATHLIDFVVAWLPLIIIGLVIKFYRQIIDVIGDWLRNVL